MKYFNSFLLLFAFVLASAQNVLKIKDLQAGSGEYSKIQISLNNADAVSGFQFKIAAPAGLILNEREVRLSGRQTDHVVYPKRLASGEYLFVCFSAKGENLSGNSGDLLEIPVEVPLDYKTGDVLPIKFTEAILSSATGNNLLVNAENGALTVAQGKSADLLPSGITVDHSTINPDEKITVKWIAKNNGQLEASPSWQEQVSFVSKTTGRRYILGSSTYSGTLPAGASTDREQTFTLPKIIGFDGAVDIEVKLIPGSGLKEPESLRVNNTAISSDLQLSKKIFIELDRTQISENAPDKIRLQITRSGDNSNPEDVIISSDKNIFGNPAHIKLEANQSSGFAYLKPTDNATYEGDRDVMFTASAAEYPDASAKIKVIDDEHIVLNIAANSTGTAVGSKIAFTLTANFAQADAQTINLTSDAKNRLKLPNSVILPAGQKSVDFVGDVLDTGVIERFQDISVIAKADGYTTGIRTIKISASGIPDFKITISQAQISEGDGVKATYAKISRTTNLDKEAVVSISEDPAGNLILPTEIIFEKGAAEKSFTVGAVDNSVVEGTRNVTIWSRIKFPSCNCTDLQEPTANTSATIEMLDNDGLSLSVLAQPSTIKAGNSGKIKISRNSKEANILQNAVMVNLTNDNPSALSLPATATIPAGASEIWVDFTTKIDANSTGDKTVRTTASGSGYSNGFGWLLLTDQNKADISVENISTPGGIQAAQKIKVSTTLTNVGNAKFVAGGKVEYYLSKTTNISGIAPISTSYISQDIAKDSDLQLKEELQLPPVAGSQYLTVLVNGDQVINELSRENNQKSVLLEILPSYSVEVATDKKVYKPGESVKITGIAKTNTGAGVASSPVEITIKNGQFTRTINVKTNSDGLFVYDFVPVQNESGNYTVSAAYPGVTSQSVAGFDILGIEIVNKPQYIKWETLVNIPLGKDFTIKNTTSSRLTNVKIEVPNNYSLNIEQTGITLEPNATATLSYKLISKEPSKELKFEEIPMRITSAEGAALAETVYYHSRMPQPTLVAVPVSINTTMVKGQKRLYEFTVKNTGAADAQDIEVKLPMIDWMKLASSKIISLLKAGEETKIALELAPTVKEQLNVPLIGNLALVPKNGGALSVPFSIETVSTNSGKLLIDAVDEYYYNTAQSPHLKGAKVTIKHPYTGAIISEGITAENGVFEIPELKEGWYTISVTADKHDPYQNNILVDPGKSKSVTAFLPYKAVTYSWDVKPVVVQDQYDIKLNVQFETNIPKPVIVMEIDNNKLDLKPGESRMTHITVTNHGLIAANNVKISISDVPGYTFTPLINSMEVLNAKSSVAIPVLLTNTELPSGQGRMSAMSARGESVCSGNVLAEAKYVCGDKEVVIFSHNYYANGSCSSASIGGGDGGGGGWGSPGGGGGGGGTGSSAGTSNITPLETCDICTGKIIKTLYSCTPVSVIIEGSFCVTDLITIPKDSLENFERIFKTCSDAPKLKTKVECLKPIICTLVECLTGFKPPKSVCKNKKTKPKPKPKPNPKADPKKDTFERNSLDRESIANDSSDNDDFSVDDYLIPTPAGNMDRIYNDLVMFDMAVDAKYDKFETYLSDSLIVGNDDKLFLVLRELIPFIEDQKTLSTQDITDINAKFKAAGISENFINRFAGRWNKTVEAWSKGITSPNENYPDIIDQSELDFYDNITNRFNKYLMQRGFTSAQELYITSLKDIDNYLKEKQKDAASACASVSLEFPQQMTMTREAFEGTLKLNNSSSKEIKDINLDLIVTDANGENKTALFQINKDAFINGTGLVTAGTTGSGKALFIPTKEAAPTVPQSYNFGGVLSYFDAEINDRVYVTLKPVALQVNPSPDLELHYFMQRNILGDDALTQDTVEPTIPAELALLIKNDGYGEAKNVQVQSMQPKIVDNEKGLAVDFNMIGSNFNNQPKELGLLNVNFGNIAPKTASVGQWWFTSSLMGHFTKYDVKVNHASSFGNTKLSLIKAAYIHELIRSIRDYRTGADALADFLVNDINDAQDTPDRIYLSTGSTEEVYKAESLAAAEKASSSALALKLTLSPSASGWNYGFMDDPGAGNYKLQKVVRDSDQKEMPLENFWQSYVTLRDGLNPKYENKLHAVDYISVPTTYTLYYKPSDGNIPEVVNFEDVPSENSPKPVEAVRVRFNKEIDVNTFTNKNIELLFQGAKIPSDNILIGKIDATTYSISLKGLTQASGYYQLTVNALGIKDIFGNEGRDGKKISWIQFVNELGILEFKTDQLKKQPVNTVTVIFNKIIRSEEFTGDRVLLNSKPVPNAKVSKINDYTYAVSGLQEYNRDNAGYTIAINTAKITSVDGIKGIGEQAHSWTVNTVSPEIISITPWYQGARHPQHVTDFEIKLNEKIISGLDASAVGLYRDGQKLAAEFIIKNNDGNAFVVTNFANLTSGNGSYKFVVSQGSLKDENENIGSGQKEFQWQVNHQDIPPVQGLRLTPDRGVSNTDNITSGDVELAFETTKDDLSVEIFEMQATQPVPVAKIEAPKAGRYSLPLGQAAGAKRYKLVASDKVGNQSPAAYLEGYIDNTSFEAIVEPVKLLADQCSGFDYVKIRFTEAVDKLPNDALSVTASGVVMPQDKMHVKKVDDLNYTIEGITTDSRESASLKVNLKKVSKKLSGLMGTKILDTQIGIASLGSIEVSGSEKPILDAANSYTATDNMMKYDWIAINGEILQSDGKNVTIKWKKTGQQSLVLKYVTLSGCTSTIVKNVEVAPPGGTLATVNEQNKPMTLAPVPNDGTFTIFTSKVLPRASISIYDMSGKLVHQQKNLTIGNRHEVVMQKPVSGIYIIIIQNDEERYQFKFIVK